ncbi:UNVERIFIED_CONTAM: hypothetical protein HDU68_006442 [Siphonaria sp. JEL0065]|nr:hypothetical protein HDU68_006442 [Siphonaria sp. JEL0065]
MEMMSLSKYHSIIVTETHLYSFGFGLGGRLGLNHEETTLLPSIVHEISDLCITFVATGPDHTVALSENGQVFTWGSNKFGQLGYETLGSNNEPSPVLVPTEVIGPLKKVKIIGAAASKYHTVVFSNNGLLYSWGWNVGQLGYEQPANTSQLQQAPRKITSMLQSDILQVSATNNATAVLLTKGDVLVLANHEIKRVVFTASLPPLIKSTKDSFNSSIVKIVSGNHQFAALSKDGDVFLWSPPVTVEEFKSSWQQLNFPQTKPKRIWTARKKSMRAKDIAVGIDSTILVATESGHVYSGARRNEVKTKESKGHKDVVYFKFSQAPYLSNIRLVYASLSGAFSAIRFDELPPVVSPGPVSLRADLKKMMMVDSDTLCTPAGSPFVDVEFVFHHDDCEYLYEGHQVILASRSPFFKRVFEELSRGNGAALETDSYCVTTKSLASDSSVPIVHISFKKEYYPKAFSSALELIYTGGFSREWEVNASSAAETRSKNGKTRQNAYVKVQSDFFALTRLFELDQTSAISGTPLDKFLRSFEFCRCKSEEKFLSSITDVALDLLDGRLFCHQLFLAARSPFFDAMFGAGSQWMLKREKIKGYQQNLVVVDLGHFTMEVMEIVLDWMYTDLNIGYLLRNLCRPTFLEYLGVLIDLLSVANELLLDRLKEQVCGLLSERVDLGNVIELLEVADTYDAKQLKSNCLMFLCWNLSSVIESRLLESAPEYLISDIEETLQNMQIETSPSMRGPNGFYERIRSIVAVEELERKLYTTSAVAKEERARSEAITVESRAHLSGLRAKAREMRKELAKANVSKRVVRPASTDGDLQFEMENLTLSETVPLAAADAAKSQTTPPKPKSKKAGWTKFDEASKPQPPKAAPVVPVATSPAQASSGLKSWGAPTVLALSPSQKLSLSEIMQAESTKQATAKQTPNKTAATAFIAAPLLTQGAPASPSKPPLVRPFSVQAASTSAIQNVVPSPAAPIFYPTASPAVTIPIKISAAKSQRERKRESNASTVLATSKQVPSSSSSSSSTPMAWNIPQKKAARIDSDETWQENAVSNSDFWGDGGGNGAFSVSPTLPNMATGKWNSPAKPSPSKALFPELEASSLSARPSLSEIQREETNRRKLEAEMRETIKKTSFAEIQREELERLERERERKELMEQFGVDMVFRNNTWEIVPCDVFVGASSSAAQSQNGKKTKGKGSARHHHQAKSEQNNGGNRMKATAKPK